MGGWALRMKRCVAFSLAWTAGCTHGTAPLCAQAMYQRHALLSLAMSCVQALRRCRLQVGAWLGGAAQHAGSLQHISSRALRSVHNSCKPTPSACVPTAHHACRLHITLLHGLRVGACCQAAARPAEPLCALAVACQPLAPCPIRFMSRSGPVTAVANLPGSMLPLP